MLRNDKGSDNRFYESMRESTPRNFTCSFRQTHKFRELVESMLLYLQTNFNTLRQETRLIPHNKAITKVFFDTCGIIGLQQILLTQFATMLFRVAKSDPMQKLHASMKLVVLQTSEDICEAQRNDVLVIPVL